MPGPVSDSYDPEFGTGEHAHQIRKSLEAVYRKISRVLADQPPINIVSLAYTTGMDSKIEASMTEQEWRFIRFALERAQESI